jgi:hypothetical protein
MATATADGCSDDDDDDDNEYFPDDNEDILAAFRQEGALLQQPPCFDIACLNSKMNYKPIYGTFTLRSPISCPSHFATLRNAQDLATIRETTTIVEASISAYLCMLEGSDQTERVRNLHACLGSADAAEHCLFRIADHYCAYGGKLENPAEKARTTFLSMQGGQLDKEALWFATVDLSKLNRIFPCYFRAKPYAADWIAFAVICVQGNRRTFSILFGADSD